MDNGTTSWINGASPTFTSYHIETTVITVYQTASVVPVYASGSGIESGTFESISSSGGAVLPTVTLTSLAFSTVTVSLDDTSTQTSSFPTESNSLESTRTSHVISTVTGPAVTIIESLSYVSMSGSTSNLTVHITSTVRVSKILTTTSTTQSQASSFTSPLDVSAASVPLQPSSYGVSSVAPLTSSAATMTVSTSRPDSSTAGSITSSSVSSTAGIIFGWVPLSGYSGTASLVPTSTSFRLSLYNLTIPIYSSASTADAVQISAHLGNHGNYNWITTAGSSSTVSTSSLQMLPQYHPVPYGDGRPSYSSLGVSVSPANISIPVASFDNTTATVMPSILPAAASSGTSTSNLVYNQLTPKETSPHTSIVNFTATSTPSLHVTSPLAASGFFNMTATKTSSAAATASFASQCGVQGDVLLTVKRRTSLFCPKTNGF